MRRSSLVACLGLAGLGLALLLPGCASVARRTKGGAQARTVDVFLDSLKNARSEGRREVEDILGVYAQVPAAAAPGVAGFRADVTAALARMKRAGRERLTPAEVEGLTIRNPNFWSAWLEFDPQDASLPMLHASLLMEAGELFRASVVLTVGVQAAPLNVQERMFWLVQQSRAHWTVFRRLDDLQERQRRWGKSGRRRADGLAVALNEWPTDGFAVEGLLRSRAGLATRRSDEDDERTPIALAPAARRKVAPELEKLRRLSPVAAARYAEDTVASAEFGRLWGELVDEERPIEDRALARLAEQARKLGFPEVAMVVGRAVAARRGFYVPADFVAIRQTLRELLPAAAAEVLRARLEEGSIGGLRLTKPPEPPEEVLPGMDPLTHPLLATHGLREFARETLWIEVAESDARLRAAHLRERAIRNSNIGRFDAALADLDIALRLQPKEAGWHVDRAVVLTKTGRPAEAEEAFAAARRLDPGSDYLRSSLAVQRFAEGAFDEAEALFRAAPPDDPNREYSVILGYLCTVRRGRPDRDWLRAQRMKHAVWPAPVQRLLAGEIDRGALLAAARDDSDLRTTERQCEAFFSLGQLALAAGDAEAARSEFENCVQSGITGFIEFELAKHELARLKAAREPVRRPEPPKSEQTSHGGGGVATTAARVGAAGRG